MDVLLAQDVVICYSIVAAATSLFRLEQALADPSA